MMKVKINRIKLFGYHGVYEEEKANGQEFHISVEMKINSKYLDDIISTVDYSVIIQSIKEVFNEKSYFNIFNFPQCFGHYCGHGNRSCIQFQFSQ